ncbi:hypothetical protein AAFF_G00166810 [Aldrovandia affinis]|uniref:Uncharacterized protein n=1 Tax=Aldrovandia affinis TaxID=143900 RepID=A0AAD7RMA0_9TELE|nr:hypothetical protein AAFF_G00166810 [Aldrovandia affinis]
MKPVGHPLFENEPPFCLVAMAARRALGLLNAPLSRNGGKDDSDLINPAIKRPADAEPNERRRSPSGPMGREASEALEPPLSEKGGSKRGRAEGRALYPGCR